MIFGFENHSLPKPLKLTKNLQDRLTEKFKSTGAAVWNRDFIKDSLLTMSNRKCCYCESILLNESNFLEVEHFHPKNKYVDEVLEWTNLLPSCKRCNVQKGPHDTVCEPIINPCEVDPKHHLTTREYWISGIGILGKRTVYILDLNNLKLLTPRIQVGIQINQRLDSIIDQVIKYIDSTSKTTEDRFKLINGLKALMMTGTPEKGYASTVASCIMNSGNYKAIRAFLSEAGLWDDELIQLERELNAIALDVSH